MDNLNSDASSEKSLLKKMRLPILALVFEFPVTAICLWIGMSSGFLDMLFLLFGLLSPFVGITLGIITICLGKKEVSKPGFILGLVSVILPVLVVLVYILLLKTGVAYISFM